MREADPRRTGGPSGEQAEYSEGPHPPLVVRSLGHRYGRNRPWVLRDVSLSFPAGSITALIGPNGAGKSTLIRSCLGFERPVEGRIEVFGRDPTKEAPAALAQIGYIPQAMSLHRKLTIADHFVLARYARPKFDLDHALLRIGGANLTPARRVADLSGGEQAQVALSLALGTRASLLLLDEPLASLDPLSRRDFLTTLLADVRETGATVVLSSHIIADVEHVSDRVVVLGGGRAVLEESIGAAKARYRVVPAPKDAHGSFAAPSGARVILSELPSVGRPATLEEIVLGHLSLMRAHKRDVT